MKTTNLFQLMFLLYDWPSLQADRLLMICIIVTHYTRIQCNLTIFLILANRKLKENESKYIKLGYIQLVHFIVNVDRLKYIK